MAPPADMVPLLLAAAITPGPNNLLMLRIGLERGLRAVPAPATGVVLGGLAMLLASRSGLALAFAAHPSLPALIRVCGAACVAGLGVRLICKGYGRASEPPPPAAAPGVLALLLFQLVNPKAWLIVLTVVAAGSGPRPASLASLIA